jgi:prepilin-type N-terminal cleavage/methylation domain-containing protein
MRRRQPGFTLIELMIVVAIIGILASIAIPEFKRMQFRSRQAERSMMTSAINRAITDYYLRDQRYPTIFADRHSTLNLGWNPDANPNAQKRPFRVGGNDDWHALSLFVEGNVYYSYSGNGLKDAPPAATRFHMLDIRGDLDGDGVQDILQKWWMYDQDSLRQDLGANGIDCSLENRIPWDGSVF